MAERETGDLESTGPADPESASRIGQAFTATDVENPNRSSRNTAAGSGSEPGEGAVNRDADFDLEPERSIEPKEEGLA